MNLSTVGKSVIFRGVRRRGLSSPRCSGEERISYRCGIREQMSHQDKESKDGPYSYRLRFFTVDAK